MLFSSLLVAHVILTTLGYVGLIATNLWLLLLCRRAEPAVVVDAVSTWRATARIFGPLIGIGMLLGSWLATVAGFSLGSEWLLWTYALIVVALGAQAAIMIPWQIRAQAAVRDGGQLSVQPVVAAVGLFSLVYVALVALMTLRP